MLNKKKIFFRYNKITILFVSKKNKIKYKKIKYIKIKYKKLNI